MKSSRTVLEQYFCCWRDGHPHQGRMLVLAEPLLMLCCGAQLGSPLPALISPQALRSAGWSVSLLDLASVDHFDIIEKLSEETYVLTQVILNMIARS